MAWDTVVSGLIGGLTAVAASWVQNHFAAKARRDEREAQQQAEEVKRQREQQEARQQALLQAYTDSIRSLSAACFSLPSRMERKAEGFALTAEQAEVLRECVEALSRLVMFHIEPVVQRDFHIEAHQVRSLANFPNANTADQLLSAVEALLERDPRLKPK